MFYVYVLQSPNGKSLYYGFSSDLKQRFKAHQTTPKHAEWKLIYYEAYSDEQDARDRERMLKRYGAARGHLKQRIRRGLFKRFEKGGGTRGFFLMRFRVNIRGGAKGACGGG